MADGAKDNWKYLERWTRMQILDFYHASEHLAAVSHILYKDETSRKKWLVDACHDLKNKRKGAAFMLREMLAFRKKQKDIDLEALNEQITYFQNNLKRMNYWEYVDKGYPIGSGITEAACKVVAKQRLSASGMKWTFEVAQDTLLFRSIICTSGPWN